MNQYPLGPSGTCQEIQLMMDEELKSSSEMQCNSSSCMMMHSPGVPMMGFTSPVMNRHDGQGMGSLKRGQTKIPMPDCIQVQELSSELMASSDGRYDGSSLSTGGQLLQQHSNAMHLYMNQVAGSFDNNRIVCDTVCCIV